MHSFESVYIPGMLQTAGYARALIKATGLAAPSEIESLVQIRIAGAMC